MVAQNIVKSASKQQLFSRKSSKAADLGSKERKNLSLQVLTRSESVSQLAQNHQVSRKFLYRQASKASDALDETFTDSTNDDGKVLFYLPVTKKWICQLVLGLILICHSSFRGVLELLKSVFDYDKLSLGTIHNITRQAVEKARQINNAQELSDIRVALPDEIFQAGKPVLVGVDAKSTYCYLLSVEDHRDETTWGVRLLELSEQGLHPDYTVADGGKGLRAGQAAAWGDDVPCNGDVFHAERDFGKLAYFLENRAKGCTTARQKLERKMERAKKKGNGRAFSKKLAYVRKEELQTIELAKDIRILADWMRDDILSLAGDNLETRRQLYGFIVEELSKLKPLCSYRIAPVLKMLENSRENLLAFVGILDERFADIASRFDVPLFLVQAVCRLGGLDKKLPGYWQQRAELQKKLKRQFHDIETAVCQVLSETPRASSMVENLNSRLRSYFFLRRHIGNDYLDLLRFFLNHRRFIRSERAERVGKSPAELLTGEQHQHWLELLGFERFSQN